jgi:hypothetical protein
MGKGVPHHFIGDEKKLGQIIVFLVNSLFKAVPTISKIVM